MTPGQEDPGDQVPRARASARHAVAAFEAIGGLARAEALPADAFPPAARRGPGQDQARLARTLCALRHLADQFAGLSFGDMLDAAHQQHSQPGAGRNRPAAAARVRRADEATGICERNITTPRQYRGSFWPPDTLASLHGYASQHGLRLDSAVAALTTQLIADLRHCADHQGTDFQQALAAGLTAHAAHRLSAEGPFETGQDPAPRSPTATFPPCATNQGVVISPADAEWLLIRTAARNQAREQHGLPADRRDADDQRVLAEALADARSRPAGEILTALAPRIAERIAQIEDGPATATELGREHGRAGAPPYCDLKTEGDAAALMRALGETEAMTDANHQYRVLLVTEYADAYRQAAGDGPAPARIAARDFPRTNPPTARAGTPGTAGAARQSQAAPKDRPRHGPRPGA